MGEVAGQSAATLEKEIQKLSYEAPAPGSAQRTGGMWDRVASWFKREVGMAYLATADPGAKDRDWARVMDQIMSAKSGETLRRWKIAAD